MHATEDGILQIEKNVLVEPLIHERIKKLPSGRRKLQTKKIKRNVSISEHLDSGKIKVQNASGTWETVDHDIDLVAEKILYVIFDEYQETGMIPKSVVWFV